MKIVDICGFPSQVGDETVVLSVEEQREVEGALEVWRREALAMPPTENWASRNWQVPSALVRVDMAPLRGQLGSAHPLYEVEGGPGGLGFIHALVGNEPFRVMAECLHGLGVHAIGWEVAPSRVRFEEELFRGVSALEQHGMEVRRGLNHGLPLLLRSGGEDQVPYERCMCNYTQGGGDKLALRPFGAALSSELEDVPGRCWPDGFVFKPRYGTGASGILIYAAKAPYRRHSDSMKSMDGCWDRAQNSPERWVLQQFSPPEHLPQERLFRIWRIFAVWNGEGYRVIGGFWNARNSLRLHGATDTVWGPILVG
ncbi:MAG TPA: hypothetical protein VJL32_03750 [Candidatus Paceibacterota bacterium]